MMSISSYSFLFAVALLSKSFIASETTAKLEESRPLHDSKGTSNAIVKRDVSDKSTHMLSSNHYPFIEGTIWNGEEGDSKIIITDFDPRSTSKRFQSNKKPLGQTLSLEVPVKHLPLFTIRDTEGKVQTYDTEERRDSGDEENPAKTSVDRRDFDMLRCMLGRVYRPCWQI
ncbi:MCH protein, partial [Polypterus senegalus]|nr:pro-MCH [Polypterus senegalus]MBN3290746.1 MCH protein [Polypterus senegalus]